MKLGATYKAKLGPFGLHKGIAISAAIVIFLLAVILSFSSPDAFWNFFQIGHISPPFTDLRTIPHPSDYTGMRQDLGGGPWGFNYPEIWIYIISTMRLSQDPYLAFGILQVLLIGLVFISPYFKQRTSCKSTPFWRSCFLHPYCC